MDAGQTHLKEVEKQGKCSKRLTSLVFCTKKIHVENEKFISVENGRNH